MESDADSAAGAAAGGAPALEGGVAAVQGFLERGGPAIWALAAVSVFALALILWKFWSLARAGAWSRDRAEEAVRLWQRGEAAAAADTARSGRGLCARVVQVAIDCARDPGLAREEAEAETTRVAKRLLGQAQSGLRGLELIATVAPLLGLLGTVLGMIAAFQALETAGTQADASALAGGIWEALLTTAAGMGVAIPVSAALTWYEGVIDRLRRDMEDMAGRVLNRAPAPVAADARKAAE